MLETNAEVRALVLSLKNNQNQISTCFKLEYFHESSVDSIRFIKTVSLCSDDAELSNTAYSVEDSDGVYYIPDIHGFIGIKHSTTKNHF